MSEAFEHTIIDLANPNRLAEVTADLYSDGHWAQFAAKGYLPPAPFTAFIGEVLSQAGSKHFQLDITRLNEDRRL